jgi:hypothetical protein
MARKSESFLLVLAAVLIGVAFSEIAARLLFPDMTGGNIALRLTNERPLWARADPEFHHVGDGIYRLEFPAQAQPGPRRIMIVGDSFAMGHGVGRHERFGQLLQDRLGPGRPVDVLATSSHSPIIYRNVIRRALSLARYAAVAVFVDQTDPVDDLIYEQDLAGDGKSRSFDVARLAERGRMVDAAYAHLLGRFSGWATPRHSALVNLLRPISLADYFPPQHPHHRYLQLSLDRGAMIGRFNVDPEADDSRKMQALISDHLGQIVALCQEHRVPLFLAAVPWEFQSARWPRMTLRLPGPFPKENRVEALLANGFGHLPGVQVISLTRAFRAHVNPSSLFLAFPGHEIHWNASGHVLAEAALRQHLLAAIPDLNQTSD